MRSGHLVGGGAGFQTVVFKLLDGTVTAAAVNVRDHPLGAGVFHTHDLGHLRCDGGATHGAGGNLGLALDDGFGAVGAAGKAAAAAVCAGEDAQDLIDPLVMLHVKDLGGKGQQRAEHGAQNA